ncbi:leukotriene B4 receptor 1-like [Engraulis encrasicolus]|uniref:leukotriene B4 receptor 1-like n=1 Tax=Engraulis encrasicolus TaxID=184585 RepID=UPI002FD1C404
MNASINSSSVPSVTTGAIAGIVIRTACFLMGIGGNITVIVVLIRNFKKENFTLKLMLNLAASDIVCLSMLPFWMWNLLSGWTADIHLCRLLSFVTYTAIHASVLIVTLMSVQRYVVVLYRQQWSRLGRRGEFGVLVTVWVLAGMVSVAPTVTYNIITVEGSVKKCEQVFWSEEQKLGVALFESMALFVIPFSTLLVSYLCLQKKVSAKSMMSNHRLAKLVTCIVVTFVIFWTPYHIVNVMIMTSPSKPVQTWLRVAYRPARQVTQAIVYLNSCVNPLLYAFNYRSLRAPKPVSEVNTKETSNDTS